MRPGPRQHSPARGSGTAQNADQTQTRCDRGFSLTTRRGRPGRAKAGLLELFTDDDGDEAMRLTLEGERVARQLAMSDEGGQDALMAALIGDAEG